MPSRPNPYTIALGFIKRLPQISTHPSLPISDEGSSCHAVYVPWIIFFSAGYSLGFGPKKKVIMGNWKGNLQESMCSSIHHSKPWNNSNTTLPTPCLRMWESEEAGRPGC